MSFQQGLSGLNAASKNLDVIGNNVANANTVGFKSSEAQFADVYAASLTGGGGSNIGIGTAVTGVAQQFSQGDPTVTNNPLDVAINGNGFFRMSNNGSITYSRNGQFKTDNQGFLISSTGQNVTGYPVNSSGAVSSGTPVNLQVSAADLPPTTTTTATANVNLDSRTTVSASAFNMTDSTTYQGTTSMPVYDSLGNAHTLSMYFVKNAANSWDVYGANDGTQISATPIGQVNFTSSGAIDTSTTTMPVTLNLPVTTGASAISMSLDLTGSTQFGNSFGVNSLTQDGFAAGKLSGYSISADGTITGNYTNGQTRAEGQIALANFTNPQGLQSLGGNQWAETSASGPALTGAPKSGNLGALQSGAVEDSNVDLTSELVNMITAQRVYQANAQTIKTEDQIMQTLVSLR
ncbi:MAG TPA: flagellar hook protein FlgE [Burkholderiales bacterium]|jgi:flagellar hook protein FlgE|nr:flagellar hook protein FlgE [Burkholderiales bacterium]